MLAQLRQSRPVDTLSREHVDVVELRELLGGKGFRRAERHVTGVVDHDVEAPVLGDDFRDAGVHGFFGSDVEFDGPEIDRALFGVACGLGDLRDVTAGGFAHAGVDDVASVGECAGRKRTKTAGCTGDDDNLFHDKYPLNRWFEG